MKKKKVVVIRKLVQKEKDYNSNDNNLDVFHFSPSLPHEFFPDPILSQSDKFDSDWFRVGYETNRVTNKDNSGENSIED